MLDRPNNDIFIHMDAKNKTYDPAETLKLVKYSRVFHTPRIKVSWGSYSQVEADLLMLEAAVSQGNYEHYHILSNACLPIKTQKEIVEFFEANHGLEFLSFQSDTFSFDERVKYYYFFQEKIGRANNILQRLFRKITIMLQKILHVSRNRGIKFQKGSDWLSITDEFARYVLTQKDWIRKTFRGTYIPTECWLHTLLVNSEFKDNLYHKDFDDDIVKGSMRLIDWKRGGPYTFTIDDLELIKQSEAMFARKFDENVDSEIIREIQRLYS